MFLSITTTNIQFDKGKPVEGIQRYGDNVEELIMPSFHRSRQLCVFPYTLLPRLH